MRTLGIGRKKNTLKQHTMNVFFVVVTFAMFSQHASAQSQTTSEKGNGDEGAVVGECDASETQLKGTVTDAVSGEGLANVTLSRWTSTTAPNEVADDAPSAITNVDGSFVICRICRKAVILGVHHVGYRPASIRVEANDPGPVAIVLEPERLFRLDDVIVLAPRAIETSQGPTATTLDAQALEGMRGRHLAGTLAEIPGVTMLQAGPASAKPVVRGQSGRRLLTLFDGVRHEAQDWGVDHAPEIDPFAAGSLSVVKGAAGVRYGPDAVGGVVRIEPRPLRFKPGVDGELHMVGVDNGWRGTLAGRVDAATSWLPGFSVRIEGNGNKAAAVSTPTYVLGNTASEAFNGSITAGYTGDVFTNAVEAKVSLRHHQARLGVCYCLTATTPDDLQTLTTRNAPLGASRWQTTFDIDRPYQTVTHDLFLSRLQTELFGLGEVTATYSFQLDVRDEFDQARRAVTGPQFHFELATHTVDVVYTHPTLPFGPLALDGTFGAQFLAQENQYSGLQLIPNYRRFMGGVFAIESLSVEDVLGGTLVFELGGRYDQLVQSAFLTGRAYAAQQRRGRLDGDACTLANDVAECALALPALSVSTSAKWTVPLSAFLGKKSALTLEGDLSSATRFPDADELYLGGRAPSFPVFGLGNGSLGPETTLQAAMALGVRSSIFTGEISGYVNQVQDYIAFGPAIGANGEPQVDVVIQGAFPRFVYEATDALFYGVDVGGVIAPKSWVSLTGQLSMVHGLNVTTGGYLPFVPPPQGRVEVIGNIPTFAFFGPSKVSLASRGVLEQTRFDQASDFARPPPGYLLFDAAARTRLTILEQKVALSVEVKNLFNSRTREYMSLLRYYVDQPGREVWVRLSLDFQTL